MSKNKLLHARLMELKLGEDKKLPTEIQILKCGTYSHPLYGEFRITADDLRQMKKNFDERVRGIDCALDYEHNSEGVAAGWFKDLSLKESDNELWAAIDWTPKGQEVVTNKEFRYTSADFEYNYIHNETKQEFGPTLFGAALTNRPFVKGMEPIIELHEGKGTTMDPKDKEIADLKAKLAEQEGKAKDSETKLAEAVKLSETSKADALKLKEEKITLEKTTKFNEMMTAGKAVEAQREAYMKGDMEKFTELAQPIKLSDKGSGKEADPVTTENPEKEIMKLAEQISKDKGVSIDKAVSMALSENKTLADQYYKASRI